MLKQRNEQIQFAVRLTDTLICIFAFFAAFWIRDNSYFFPDSGISGGLSAVWWMLASSLALHLFIYPFCDFYSSLRQKRVADIVGMVFKSFLIEFFILGTLVFLVQAKETSRFFFLMFLVANYALLLTFKLSIRLVLSSIRKRGYNFRRIIVAGTGQLAPRIIRVLTSNKHWGYVPVAILREGAAKETPSSIEGIPVIGEMSQLEALSRTTLVDEILVASDKATTEEMNRLTRVCEKLGLPTRFALNLGEFHHSRVTFSSLENIPMVTYYTSLRTPAEAVAKRAMDIGAALIGLTVTAVLYPWIAWKIKRESAGPVIFKQIRIGENGRRFKCYKFRTMVLDAEARKEELKQSNEMQGPIFKVASDPRVLPFGNFLRRTSLDELPQFINILRGDMSLVGTRPPTPDEVENYETHYRRRLSIRPGLTGLWQISGRNQITNFEDILALDVEYIDRWSIWLDIQIIWKTCWMVLTRRGAY